MPAFFWAFPYSHQGVEGDATHVMVLIELVTPKGEPDFVMIQEACGFSRRELEVLLHVHQGKAARAVADVLLYQLVYGAQPSEEDYAYVGCALTR